MPKFRSGRVVQEELPSTLRRSPVKARRTFAKSYDAAEREYGDPSRAARVAWSAVKHAFEKVGDRWEPKSRRGPSDRHAARGRSSGTATRGGVDENAPKSHLYSLARRLGVRGRSRMTKPELVSALERESSSRTRRARSR